MLVIINKITKITNYKSVKVIINTLKLPKVMINMVVKYHSLQDLIIIN